LVALARAVDRPLAYFISDIDAVDLRLTQIPMFDVEAAAGLGRIPDEFETTSLLPFPTAMIENLGGSPWTVRAIRARGDSMAPTIIAGALILVDRSQRTVPKTSQRLSRFDDIFVFFQPSEGLRLKRLREDDSDVVVMSDNPDHNVEVIRRKHLDGLKIIGRAIWWDNRL
jgi:phage repressor protein C with HTH and peptisase S24 domain